MIILFAFYIITARQSRYSYQYVFFFSRAIRRLNLTYVFLNIYTLSFLSTKNFSNAHSSPPFHLAPHPMSLSSPPISPYFTYFLYSCYNYSTFGSFRYNFIAIFLASCIFDYNISQIFLAIYIYLDNPFFDNFYYICFYFI